MALRGTLGDFSVADIFQLIGHQQKTGALRIWNKTSEITVLFLDGAVVGATDSNRTAQDLIGNMMVRAEILSGPQLQKALDEQRRTMRRLGDILISHGSIDAEVLRQFAQLQITETIYRLFEWNAGAYEFTPSDSIEYDEKTQQPIRAENLLMEAFRIVDEWPAVKRVIPNLETNFTPVKALPAASAKADDDDDILAGFDSMMMGEDDVEVAPTEHIGKNERLVYDLVAPERTAQEIVDRSRLGEFETCKALANLVSAGYLQAKVPVAVDVKPKTIGDMVGLVTPVLMRIALYAVVAITAAGLLRLYEWQGQGLLDRDRVSRVRVLSLSGQLGSAASQRLRAHIEAYRLTEGQYPERLNDLVTVGISEEEDLRGPYEGRFIYQAVQSGYSLAPPLR